MDECGHTRLHLMSGGYYLGCADCGKRWVSIRNDGNDQSLDRDTRFGSMIQTYFEYIMTAIPQSYATSTENDVNDFYARGEHVEGVTR